MGGGVGILRGHPWKKKGLEGGGKESYTMLKTVQKKKKDCRGIDIFWAEHRGRKKFP